MTDAGPRTPPVTSPTIDFDTWAAQQGPRLMRLALATTGHPADAADLVQDALAAVFVRWRRLSRDGAPDAYARRIIVNRRISWWRRVGRREQPAELLDRPAPDGAAIEDVLVARRLLAGLPVTQRTAVALRFLEDLSYAEIGTLLGCAESTARSHVHRALHGLRSQWGDDDG